MIYDSFKTPTESKGNAAGFSAVSKVLKMFLKNYYNE